MLLVAAFGLLVAVKTGLAFDKMRAPDVTKPKYIGYSSDHTSVVKLVLTGGIRFYASVISPADGPRSPSYPTGTAYGIEAINTYGFFPGIILISDRLLHETDRNLGPSITLFGTERYFDPPAYNTYWWDPSVLEQKP